MADWVLYASRAGRFKSSTKKTILAEPGGPYELPDFFCRLDVMLDCKTEALPMKGDKGKDLEETVSKAYHTTKIHR